MKIGHDALDLIAQKEIIRIEQRDNFPPAGGIGGVESGGLSAIRLADQPQARVLLFVLFDHANRVVRRPIISNDELDVRVRLIESALDRFADVAGVVVIRYQNRNQRLRR